MKRVEAFLSMECECPKCHEIIGLEWADEYNSDLSEGSCEKCGTEFQYCHPENQYGI